MTSSVFVNRTLNLKKIRFMGFDMDHTLVRYKSEAFEALSFESIKDKLIGKGYPPRIRDFQFDFQRAIRGLAVDRKRGNLLKLNRHSAIRLSYHGTKMIDFRQQNRIYQSTYIDLNDPNYEAVDTIFSISYAVMFSYLVDLKEAHPELGLPDFAVMAEDVLNSLDEAHRDGSIKGVVRKNLGDYIIIEPEVAWGLEKFKRHGKKLFIVTNSDFSYTKALLDHAITPHLKEHSSWVHLFDYVITMAQKPRFFYDDLPLLQVDLKSGLLCNYDEPMKPGVYQGGSAKLLTRDLKLQPDEILYIGDHIYGDILRLKKDCSWRTAMVIEELDAEIQANRRTKPISQEIDRLMNLKEPLEQKLTDLMTRKGETQSLEWDDEINKTQEEIGKMDIQIASLIKKQQAEYNPSWGPLMRVGNEESYFAYQVERYACVYMSKLADLLALSPRSYFRAPRRILPHEMENGWNQT